MQSTTITNPVDYHTLFTALPGIYLLLAPDFTILDASDGFLKATLSKREELKGQHLFSAFPDNPAAPESLSSSNLQHSLQQVLARSKPHTMPVQRYDIPRPQAIGGGFEEKYWLITNFPVADESGKIIYLVAQAIDVTMQQLAHRQIQTNRERVEILAQATSDVIWDQDLLNNYIFWSESLKDTFGYEAHELSFINDWANCVHPEDKERVVTGISSVMQHGGRIWSDSYRFLRKDGEYAHILEKGYIIRDENGIAYRMVGAMLDITQQVKQYETLSQ